MSCDILVILQLLKLQHSSNMKYYRRGKCQDRWETFLMYFYFHFSKLLFLSLWFFLMWFHQESHWNAVLYKKKYVNIVAFFSLFLHNIQSSTFHWLFFLKNIFFISRSTSSVKGGKHCLNWNTDWIFPGRINLDCKSVDFSLNKVRKIM